MCLKEGVLFYSFIRMMSNSLDSSTIQVFDFPLKILLLWFKMPTGIPELLVVYKLWTKYVKLLTSSNQEDIRFRIG